MRLSKILKNINLTTEAINDIDIEKITAKAELLDENTLFILPKGIKNDFGKIKFY